MTRRSPGSWQPTSIASSTSRSRQGASYTRGLSERLRPLGFWRQRVTLAQAAAILALCAPGRAFPLFLRRSNISTDLFLVVS
jgi:hypothetical protein